MVDREKVERAVRLLLEGCLLYTSDIKCRMSGLRPNAVVLVATIKALKYKMCIRDRSYTDVLLLP